MSEHPRLVRVHYPSFYTNSKAKLTTKNPVYICETCARQAANLLSSTFYILSPAFCLSTIPESHLLPSKLCFSEEFSVSTRHCAFLIPQAYYNIERYYFNAASNGASNLTTHPQRTFYLPEGSLPNCLVLNYRPKKLSKSDHFFSFPMHFLSFLMFSDDFERFLDPFFAIYPCIHNIQNGFLVLKTRIFPKNYQKKLPKTVENPQYLTTFIIFNCYRGSNKLFPTPYFYRQQNVLT